MKNRKVAAGLLLIPSLIILKKYFAIPDGMYGFLFGISLGAVILQFLPQNVKNRVKEFKSKIKFAIC